MHRSFKLPAIIGGSLLLGSILPNALLAPPLTAQSSFKTQQIFRLSAEEKELLGHQSIVYLDDGQGGLHKTLRISGINVQVVNGSGTTDGTPSGLGNLLVGYNELRGIGDDRTGSHNIIGGKENNYSRYGGFISGRRNSASGNWSSAIGGTSNNATGQYSVTIAGERNLASGVGTATVGGGSNIASSYQAATIGGQYNQATGQFSTVTGGASNAALSNSASVSGGILNSAGGYAASSVSGGFGNQAAAYCATVSGGSYGTAGGYFSSVSGGYARGNVGANDWSAGALAEDL